MNSGADGSRGPDMFALGAIALTIALHLVIKLAGDKPSVPFIAGASLFWTMFVIVRAWQDNNAFREWGFHSQNLMPTAAASAVLFCIGAVGMGMIAEYQGSLDFPLHTLVLFLVLSNLGSGSAVLGARYRRQ
jgi:hypothetical protein